MDPLERSTLVPAPGRGQYDRSLSRARRQAEQQERLLAAVAEAFALSGANIGVGAVVQRAGTGRNTFYEYFDDVAHALAVVRAHVESRIEGALGSVLSSARTPVERLRVVSRAFIESLSQHPYEAAVGLRRERESDALSPVGRALCAAYVRALEATRRPTPDDEMHALVVSAGAEALFARRVLEPLLATAREQTAPSEASDAGRKSGVDRVRISAPKASDRDEVTRGLEARAPVDLLVDLAVRVLR
jgi:AcrR family transcriptional regulator